MRMFVRIEVRRHDANRLVHFLDQFDPIFGRKLGVHVNQDIDSRHGDPFQRVVG